MNTATILRQVMHELRAAYEEARMEYGAGSVQAEHIADALAWMSAWFDVYVNVDTASRPARRSPP